MNELESRKRLLIAESELNRAQLVGELAALKSGARALPHRAVAALALGLASCRRRSPAARTSSSRLQPLSDGATLVAALWLAFRAQIHRPGNT